MSTKTSYANGITAFGTERITMKDVRKVLKDKEFFPDDAILVGSQDEEGNRFGYVFTLIAEQVTEENLGELEVPGLKIGDTVVICTPAI